jgi:hypothetical protein
LSLPKPEGCREAIRWSKLRRLTPSAASEGHISGNELMRDIGKRSEIT